MIPEGMIAKDFYLSSSAIDKIETCPATGVYLLAEKKEKVEPWLWWGIFIHRFLEYVQTRGRDQALAYIEQKFPRGLNTCRRIDTNSIPTGQPEMALAHDVYERKTRQLFGMGQKPNVASETYSRCDLVFRDDKKDGRLHVADYKSGDPGPDPTGNVQLLGQAAAVMDYYGLDDAIDVSLVSVRSTGELVWRTITLEADELHAFAERSKKVHLQVMDSRRELANGVPPAFVPTELHCKWCYLKPICPAHPKEIVTTP